MLMLVWLVIVTVTDVGCYKLPALNTVVLFDRVVGNCQLPE